MRYKSVIIFILSLLLVTVTLVTCYVLMTRCYKRSDFAHLIHRNVFTESELQDLQLSALISRFDGKQIEVYQYKDKYVISTRKSTVKRFVSEAQIQVNTREQIKLNIEKFVLIENICKKIAHLLDADIVNNPTKAMIRISRLPWTYGNHFDPTYNVVVQLHGKRTFTLSHDDRVTIDKETLTGHTMTVCLHPGDILLIPPGICHLVHTKYGDTGVSVALNLIYQAPRSKKTQQIADRWRAMYPKRVRELELKIS